MYIGIDIGGSHFEIGLVDDDFNIVSTTYYPNSINISITELINNIKLGVGNIFNSSIKSIGIAFPGIVDINTGRIIKAGNLKCENMNIAEKLKGDFNVDVFCDNDANCIAIAEYCKGNLKNEQNSIAICVGTGIGAGLILNNKIHRGSSFVAGEIGHMIIKSNGIDCACGRKGCYQKYASLSALIQMYKEQGYNFKSIKEGFEAKDKTITKINDQWLDYLAEGIANIYNIVDLDKVIIGGGLSENFNYIKEKLVHLVQSKVFNPEKNIQIDKTYFDNKSGIIGSAMLGSIIL